MPDQIRTHSKPEHSHVAAQDSHRYSDDRTDVSATCKDCKRPIRSFLIDGEDDRNPRWSHWASAS
jgi:hypothetical protein